jgi:DNA-binding XRE family transcriptional regulator
VSRYPLPELDTLITSGEARRLREDAGIAAATMADALGVTRNWFSRVERGDALPSRHLGPRYLRVLQGLARHEQAWQEPRRVAVLVARDGTVRAEVAEELGSADEMKARFMRNRRERAAAGLTAAREAS